MTMIKSYSDMTFKISNFFLRDIEPLFYYFMVSLVIGYFIETNETKCGGGGQYLSDGVALSL